MASYREAVDEYYDNLQDFGLHWVKAYGFYTEVASFKIYTGMGGVVGLDFDRARHWLVEQYGLNGSYLSDLMRRLRIIDSVITNQYNEYLESKSNSKSGGSSGPVLGGRR